MTDDPSAGPSDLRVAVIGPILPYRGGIAQHTTALVRALSSMVETRTFSFSRQYPARLFPGESDRDPDYEGHAEEGSSYDLDTVDPRTWRRTARDVIDWEPDVVVLPWWHIYFAPAYRYLERRMARAGIPVVLICHNVVEHESAPWRRRATRSILRAGAGLVVHTQVDLGRVREMLPEVPVEVHPMPVFELFPGATGSLPREHQLELLFSGFVRPYKGLDVLIEALAEVDPGIDFRLTVAGEFWSGAEPVRRRIRELDLSSRVDVIDRYLPEAELAELFERSDLVVLPYRSASGSAVVALAYHFSRPVLVTDVGGLPDVVVEGSTGFVVPADSPTALAAAIERAATADLAGMRAGISEHVERNLSWRSYAETVIDLARRLRVPQGAARRPGRRPQPR